MPKSCLPLSVCEPMVLWDLHNKPSGPGTEVRLRETTLRPTTQDPLQTRPGQYIPVRQYPPMYHICTDRSPIVSIPSNERHGIPGLLPGQVPKAAGPQQVVWRVVFAIMVENRISKW